MSGPITFTRAQRRRSAEPAFAERVARITQRCIVLACALFVLVEAEPLLILRDTTAAGGDMGAHVWFPAFMRDHLLGDLRVSGWTMDLLAGFPAGQFYFPLPAVVIDALSIVLPYNVAFKIVTVAGAVLMPVGAAVFVGGLRAPRPAPAVAALASTAFLFFKGSPWVEFEALNQRIMGGTLTSTLAGEFSFTIALTFALFFLGALAWSLDRRSAYWVPALLGAAVVLSHIIVAIFAVLGALVIWATRDPRRNTVPALAIGAVAGALTAFWSLPMVANLSQTSDMRYDPITSYVAYLFPGYFWWMVPFLAVTFLVGFIERRTSTLVIVILTALMGLGFRFWESVSFGPVWNLRMLGFWYLGLYLLTGIGAAEAIRGAGIVARRVTIWADDPAVGGAGTVDDERDAVRRDDLDPRPGPVGAPDPGRPDRFRAITMAALVVALSVGTLAQLHATRGYLNFWARWNYSGIEETDAGGIGKAHPEFRAIVDALEELEPGRVLWEPSEEIDRYGTTLALSTLPYWTDGRFPSLEGVYYEAAAMTPYVFLAVSNVTAPGKASNPVRGLTYGSIAEFEHGVNQLQALGARYFLAQSEDAKAAAAADDRLTLVGTVEDADLAPADWDTVFGEDAPLVTAQPPVRVEDVRADERGVSFRVSEPGSSVLIRTHYSPNWVAQGADGPTSFVDENGYEVLHVVPIENEVRLDYVDAPFGWEIYEVAGAELVSPLAVEPVVITDLAERPARECWEARGLTGLRDERLAPWECVAAPWWMDAATFDRPIAADGPSEWRRVDDVAAVADEEPVALEPVEVSDIEVSQNRISFSVDRTGVPVVVKVSAYPNWRADGADGPWLLAPHFMVVVPTAEQVTLEFATTGIEQLGRVVTLGGFVGLGFLVWWIPGRRPRPRRGPAGSMVDGRSTTRFPERTGDGEPGGSGDERGRGTRSHDAPDDDHPDHTGDNGYEANNQVT